MKVNATSTSPSWTDNADLALYCVLMICGTFVLRVLLPIVDINSWGIRPRTVAGLWGIPLCPLLHGSLAHLSANCVALFVLLTLSLSLSRRLTLAAVMVTVFLGGAIVWLCGKKGACYIGASGLVFGLAGFLVAAGLFRGEWKALGFAVLVFLLYGGMIAGILRAPPRNVSWLSHASGLLCGIATGWWTRKTPRTAASSLCGAIRSSPAR